MTRERCPICDREALGDGICGDPRECFAQRVRWRERALAAEAECAETLSMWEATQAEKRILTDALDLSRSNHEAATRLLAMAEERVVSMTQDRDTMRDVAMAYLRERDAAREEIMPKDAVRIFFQWLAERDVFNLPRDQVLENWLAEWLPKRSQ